MDAKDESSSQMYPYETFNCLNLPKRQKINLVLFSLLIFNVGIRHQFALVFAPSFCAGIRFRPWHIPCVCLRWHI